MFSTCVKIFLKNTPIFSGKSVPTQEKCPYPKAEGWKQKQYFLSTSASCQKGLLPAENIKGSSVEINVNELSFFHHKILINTVITFHTKNCFDNGYNS